MTHRETNQIDRVAAAMPGLGGKNTPVGATVLANWPKLTGDAFAAMCVTLRAAKRRIETKRLQRRLNHIWPRVVVERDMHRALDNWTAWRRDYCRRTKVDRLQAEAERLQAAVRRAVQGALRKAGFGLDHSADGSNYYGRWNEADNFRQTIRISDHEVPWSPERQFNADNGGVSWAHADFVDVTEFASVEAALAAVKEMIHPAEEPEDFCDGPLGEPFAVAAEAGK